MGALKTEGGGKDMHDGVYRKLCELLALEYNCEPGDFDGGENRLTLPVLQLGRRAYSPEPPFFQMVTTGSCAVATADEELHPFLEGYLRKKPGHWLFELPNLLPLERELARFGRTLTSTWHMFLPTGGGREPLPLSLRWYYDEEILPFYGDPRFPNAICPEYKPERPDRIVVCAMEGEEIIAMAGCSEDAPGWMQIGIDVMSPWRSKGVGSSLVKLLKDRIEERGAIPFYGTSLSNYHSWNVALNTGFRPAWVEIGSRKLLRGD